MKQLSIWVLSFLLFLSVGLNAYLLKTSTKISENIFFVKEVIDGDTFITNTNERIRLLGVNAPELTKCYGKKAQKGLEQLILGKQIQVKETKKDAFGRTMGLVYSNGELINTRMIELGFGKPDYTKNSQKDAFIDAYEEAKKQKNGIAGNACKRTSKDPFPDPLCTIKGNIETSSGEKMYHLPTCRHYDQIVIDLDTDENFFCSEEEAQAEGFFLAKDCLR